MDAVIRSLPNLWPSQLLPKPGVRGVFPLNRPDVELTYLGRNAVWRAVKRLGLSGTEIIVPAYHHGVEVDALLAAGARVRFARVDASLRMDLEDVESLIGPATSALYVIHYAGFPQPMEPLLALARKHGLRVIEDCALSLFSREGERPLGLQGDAAIFCFYKTVPVSHGGALLVNPLRAARPLPRPSPPPLLPALSHTAGSLLYSMEQELGEPGRAARNVVKTVTSGLRRRADAVDVPVGTQLFDPAAVGLGMSALTEQVLRAADAEDIVRRRRANWNFLHRQLGELRRSPWEELTPGVCPLFYALRVEDKDEALALLRARGIEAVDFWRFGHPTVERERFPTVERLRAQLVELPCHQDLAPEHLQRVVDAARDAVRGRPAPQEART